MKPEDIPQEVWERSIKLTNEFEYDEALQAHASMSVLGDAAWHDVAVVARAIMAAQKRENEACARLIEEGFDRAGIVTKNDQCPHNKYGWEDCEQCAVAAIRNRGKP